MVQEFQFNAEQQESYITVEQVNPSRCREHSSSRDTDSAAEPLARERQGLRAEVWLHANTKRTQSCILLLDGAVRLQAGVLDWTQPIP